MSGGKYRIEQNGKFLGHWSAHTPEEALNKMFHSLYAKCYNVDDYGTFDIYKNGKHEQVRY